ncbi:DUF2268 domain-containing protein [Anaerosporobacter faecicola]|uniref:DUF2268 domain-containing protein n=1 Tax=Anaerosporobacter faecicola TaxID=2718714 RepID=UPI00143C3E7D|nr:DUF2268 domain-containing protein [Anaerosporobacter faecicola]
MKIEAIRSGEIYDKIRTSIDSNKENIYRYELMKPFEKKWGCYQIPICAKTPGGYDVIMASEMLGILPPRFVNDSYEKEIALLKQDQIWRACETTMVESFSYFEKKGIELPVDTYRYSILLANPDSVYTKLSDGYCGDGGIPGYIFLTVLPNAYTLDRLPAAMAHECNHNVRFQFIKWSNDITLEEMMVTEGLAENFAVSLCGIEHLGPWVSKITKEELMQTCLPILKEGLEVQGLDQITAYLYGDEIATEQGYQPVGLPFCAGYACGFYLVQYYLEKTGVDIAEATLKPAKEILDEVREFFA